MKHVSDFFFLNGRIFSILFGVIFRGCKTVVMVLSGQVHYIITLPLRDVVKVYSLILPPVLNTCLSDLGCDGNMSKLS